MKTVRGTYYVIQLGSSYYAGETAVKHTVTKTVPRALTAREKAKPRYDRGRGPWWEPDKWIRVPGKKGTRSEWRWGRYDYSLKKPTEKIEVDVPTGQYIEDWTEDFAKAKPFRLKKKADERAEQLAKSNSTKDIKVRFFDGTQVRT